MSRLTEAARNIRRRGPAAMAVAVGMSVWRHEEPCELDHRPQLSPSQTAATNVAGCTGAAGSGTAAVVGGELADHATNGTMAAASAAHVVASRSGWDARSTGVKVAPSAENQAPAPAGPDDPSRLPVTTKPCPPAIRPGCAAFAPLNGEPAVGVSVRPDRGAPRHTVTCWRSAAPSGSIPIAATRPPEHPTAVSW